MNNDYVDVSYDSELGFGIVRNRKLTRYFQRRRNDALYQIIMNAKRKGRLRLPGKKLWITEKVLSTVEALELGCDRDQLDTQVFGTVTPGIELGKKTIHQGYSEHYHNTLADELSDQNLTLLGYWVESQNDLQSASEDIMFQSGGLVPVRVKLGDSTGGNAHVVVRSRQELDAVVEFIGKKKIKRGFVVEENIENALSISVGTNIWGHPYIGIQRHESVSRNIESFMKDNWDSAGASDSYAGTDMYTYSSRLGDVEEYISAIENGAQLPVNKDIAMKSLEILGKMIKIFRSKNISTGRLNIDLVVGKTNEGEFVLKVLEFGPTIGGASVAEIAAVLIIQDLEGGGGQLNSKIIDTSSVVMASKLKKDMNTFLISHSNDSKVKRPFIANAFGDVNYYVQSHSYQVSPLLNSYL